MLLVLNLLRESPQRDSNKKSILNMESGMSRKLEENSRMTGEITKLL